MKNDTYPTSAFQYDSKTDTCTCPAGRQLTHIGNREDQSGNHKAFFIGQLLQCRHCDLKHQCMKKPESSDQINGRGRQVSFMLDKSQKSKYTDWMKARVDSDKGKQIYSHRMSVVEPVFGNIGTNKRLSRFSLRTKKKVQGQWRLYCLVHNIEKIMNYGVINQ